MDTEMRPQGVLLAYFSGTGCTKAVCDRLEEQLLKAGAACRKTEMALDQQVDLTAVDMIIILAPVYACRLVSLAEKWVRALPPVAADRRISAALISVSGAGEVTPNTACRVCCRRILKRKGYELRYETMLVMPSNFATTAGESLDLALLRVLPAKVEKIAADILDGKQRITTPKPQDRLFALLGRAEHLGAKFFGAFIRVSPNCSRCGLCARRCPGKNIRLENGSPKFAFRCLWCMKCLYNCPQQALSPGIIRFCVLKAGFDLARIREKAEQESSPPDHKHSKSLFWQGVIDYLAEED